MTPFVPLEEMIEGSDRLHAELAGHLAAENIVTDHREDLASVLSTLVVEHAHSILLLVMEDKPSSALALVRVQYEALLRAAWINFAASDHAVEKCVAPIPPGVTKEPDLFPTVGEMLKAIDGKAPAPLVRALSEFKAAAWGAELVHSRPATDNGGPSEWVSPWSAVANDPELERFGDVRDHVVRSGDGPSRSSPGGHKHEQNPCAILASAEVSGPFIRATCSVVIRSVVPCSATPSRASQP
ncbi:MAG: hypothetical protein NTW01_03545 [Gammaproteobacteria bacterium]|nr:hypothetical protein [Gammaproteobacteria bacterium]